MPAAVPAIINAAVAYASTVGAQAAFIAATKAFFITALATVGLQAIMPRPKLGRGLAQDTTGRSSLASGVEYARWVVGTSRTAGVPFWWKENGRSIHIGYAISEGRCEDIVAVHVAGTACALREDRAHIPDGTTRDQHIDGGGDTRYSVIGGPYAGQLSITAYLGGNGLGGQALRDAAAGDGDGLSWGATDKLNGISYLMVTLTQPAIQSGRRPLYTAIPQIEFVVLGVHMPAINTGTGAIESDRWTENAAEVRRWWLTTRRGVAANHIDTESARASTALANDNILPQSLTDSSEGIRWTKRYTINGVISAGDDPSAVEREMDIAMSGHAPVWDGMHLIRAGGERPQRLVLEGDDLLEHAVIRPGLDYTNKVNRMTMAMRRSAGDYTGDSITVDDAESQVTDGRVLTQNVLQSEFIVYKERANEILQGYLAEARASQTIDVTARPRKNGEWSIITLIPGDKVGLYLPEYGIGSLNDDGTVVGKDYLVVKNNVERFRCQLTLREWPADRFVGQVSNAPPEE